MNDRSKITFLKKQGIYVSKSDEQRGGKVLFMFAGHGSQYVNMLSGLIEKYEVAKQIVEKADVVYKRLTGNTLSKYIYESDGRELKRAEVMQPAIFMANYIVYSVLQTMGIKPDVLIGHSFGEFSALAAANVIGYEDGIEIAYYRACALNEIQQDKRGTMLSIKIESSSVILNEEIGKLESQGFKLNISLVNTKTQAVVSGEENAIYLLEEKMSEKKIITKRLNVSHAFHSELLANAMESFKRKLLNYKFKVPEINIYSTISNKMYSRNEEDYQVEIFANFLSQQFVKPFCFFEQINWLYDEYNVRYFIESSASNILSNLVDQILQDKEYYGICANEKKVDDLISIQKLKLYLDLYKRADKEIKDEESMVSVEYVEAEHRINIQEESNMRMWKRKELEELLKSIIAEKTGYPIEILELDLDLEADLGIDSVKQADIFATLFTEIEYEKEESGEGVLVKFDTIHEIVEFCLEKMKDRASGEVVATLQEEDAEEEEGVTVSQSSANKMTKQELEELVKQVIVEKTGYPVDILESELDIEADLGIDSVKRMDIMSSVLINLGYKMQTKLEMPVINTINDIIEYLYEMQNSVMAEGEKETTFNLIENYSDKREHMRYITVSKNTSYGEEKVGEFDIQGKNVLIITDRLGGEITRRVVSRLESLQCKVVVLAESKVQYKEGQVIYCDFADNEAMKAGCKEVKKCLGTISGIINLYSFCEEVDFAEVDYETWNNEIDKVYLSAFYALKSAYDDFVQLGEKAFYCAVSNLGGVFGIEADFSNNSSSGINSGIVKAISREIKLMHCKMVDFAEKSDNTFVVDKIFEEIRIIDYITEVSYIGERRKSIKVIPKELEKSEYAQSKHLSEDDVILFVGGSRGILNEFIRGTIHVYNPTIIVIGRATQPGVDEEWGTMTDEEFTAYKPIFISKMKKQHQKMSVTEIVNQYRFLENRRKLSENINKLKQLSNKVHYYACDISNKKEVLELEEKIKNKFGGVTGIVNGAGLPSFGLLPKKHEIGALKAMNVKGLGLYNIYHVFHGHPLSFISNVGSISGRFGIDGQVDYVAACDLTVKMTQRIKKMNPNFQCYIMDWTAWEDVGMAAQPLVEDIQRSRGLNYISVKEGTQRFLEELAYGRENKEVLVFNSIGNQNQHETQLNILTEDLKRMKSPIDEDGNIIDKSSYPFIDKVVMYEKDRIVISRKLNIKNDVHLRDHVVKGNYVFAGVSHIEMLIELADLLSKLWDETWYLYKTEAIDLYMFVKYFELNPLTLISEMKVLEKTDEKVKLECEIRSDFCNSKGMTLEKNRLHSKGIIVLSRNKINKSLGKYNIREELENSIELDFEKYYAETADSIFFGPLFRSLNYVKKITSETFLGEIESVDDSKLFLKLDTADTLMCPITMDCIGRVALVGLYNEYGIVSVPIKFQNIVIYRKIIKYEKVYAYTKVVEYNSPEILIHQLIIDGDDNIICKLEIQLHEISKVDSHNLELGGN